jgi:hypothetical protein
MRAAGLNHVSTVERAPASEGATLCLDGAFAGP